MTLRGTLECMDGNRSQSKQVLDYVSPDRTRGWRIKKAYLWLNTIRATTATDDHGMMIVQAVLSTEAVPQVFDQTVEDNRLFGWMQQQFFKRTTSSGSSTDYMLPNAGWNLNNRFLVDTDTIIVKELWIQMSTAQDGTDEPNRKYNYLIECEEIKLSPEHSVFQQIKGMGQDLA